MRVPLALSLALALAGAAAAGDAASDLHVHYSQDRWARLKANPRTPTQVRRATRPFTQVIRPHEVFFVPTGDDRTLFPRTRSWGDWDNTDAGGRPQADGPRVLTRHPPDRSMWLRFQLFGVPPGALVHRAELRMAMAVGDLEREQRYPTRVRFSPSPATPQRLRRIHATELLMGPAVRVRHNYPSMWWDVTSMARVVQGPGETWRSLTLAIENAGHLRGRRPELHVWYSLALDATAE